MRVTKSVELGPGVHADLVREDGAAIPLGAVVHHAGGRCKVSVEWGHTLDDPFVLESLSPLAVDPAVTCPACGVTAVIRDGRWIEL